MTLQTLQLNDVAQVKLSSINDNINDLNYLVTYNNSSPFEESWYYEFEMIVSNITIDITLKDGKTIIGEFDNNIITLQSYSSAIYLIMYKQSNNDAAKLTFTSSELLYSYNNYIIIDDNIIHKNKLSMEYNIN